MPETAVLPSAVAAESLSEAEAPLPRSPWGIPAALEPFG
jgi:hypothetical protein